jgi:hypothetical protein
VTANRSTIVNCGLAVNRVNVSKGTKIKQAAVRSTPSTQKPSVVMFHNLKDVDDTPEKHAHIFNMIRAAELAAKGSLDEEQAEAAMKDFESAAMYCEPEPVATA